VNAFDSALIPSEADDPNVWRLRGRISEITQAIDKENATLSNLNEEATRLENKRRWVREAVGALELEKSLLQAWINTTQK